VKHGHEAARANQFLAGKRYFRHSRPIGTTLGPLTRAALTASAAILITAISLVRLLVSLAVGLAPVTIIAATSFNRRERLCAARFGHRFGCNVFHSDSERWPAERAIHDSLHARGVARGSLQPRVGRFGAYGRVLFLPGSTASQMRPRNGRAGSPGAYLTT
jgi:hypothetical protein